LQVIGPRRFHFKRKKGWSASENPGPSLAHGKNGHPL
jgi:hypothetical protein